MTSIPVVFHAETNVATLAGVPHVFHCHYYNCALQDAIERALGSEAPTLLRDEAETAARAELERVLGAARGEAAFALGRELFQQLGFGSFDATAVSASGGVVTSDSSHYALGWLAMYGPRPRPACHFVAGYLKALFSIAFARERATVNVTETECLAAHGANCRFDVEVQGGH